MTIIATIPASAPAASTAPAAGRIAYSKSLLLRKVPRRSTIDDIKTIFESFGAVRDVYIPVNVTTGRKETYAFIEFEALKDSMKAYEYFSTNEMLLEGIILRVDYAKNGRRSPEQMVVRPAAAEPAAPASPRMGSRTIAIQAS
jgi:FUS-interacting serine-arginine-rich protein 1